MKGLIFGCFVNENKDTNRLEFFKSRRTDDKGFTSCEVQSCVDKDERLFLFGSVGFGFGQFSYREGIARYLKFSSGGYYAS